MSKYEDFSAFSKSKYWENFPRDTEVNDSREKGGWYIEYRITTRPGGGKYPHFVLFFNEIQVVSMSKVDCVELFNLLETFH